MFRVILQQRSLEQRLGVVLTLFLIIIVAGAAGYVWIESWPWLDAIYMSTITVTTVGFSETHPLSAAGQMFTIVLVTLGVGAFTYTFSSLAQYLISGELQGVLAQRRMKRQTERLKDHYIVCGYGRVGREVVHEFQRERKSMVIIDHDERAILEAQQLTGCLILQGDAGEDEVLHEAGIKRAKGLVAAADTDATNVMIALSARAINAELFTVARANSEINRAKLSRAGADRIISPAIIGGRSMAQMALRPNVVEFLDVVARDKTVEYWIEDLTVTAGSMLDGTTVGETDIRKTTGVTLLTIRRREDQRIVLPTPETQLRAGDMVMAFGTREQLEQLQTLVD